MDSEMNKETAASRAPSYHELVKEMAGRFITLQAYGGDVTPIDFVLRLQAFGVKIWYTTSGEGVINWVGDTLHYGQIEYSMSQLRCMVHGMIATARQQILQELLLLKLDSKGIVNPTTTPCPVLY
ncbi:hypothetical protein ACJQWK_10445 [Exserohilum turcicum]